MTLLISVDVSPGAEWIVPGSNTVIHSRARNYEKEAETSSYSLKWVTRGEEEYISKGRRWRLRPGEVLLVRPGIRLAARAGIGSPAEGICIYMEGQELEQITGLRHISYTDPDQLAANPDPVAPDFPDSPLPLIPGGLSSCIADITQMVNAHKTGTLPLNLTHLIGQTLLEEATGFKKQLETLPHLNPAARSEILVRLRRSLSLIQEDFASPLTLEDLASAAAMSVFHYSRLFRRVFGTSPMSCLIRKRICEASRLLYHSSLPAGEIAFLTGFGDPAAFSKAFRKYTGYSPVAYRKRKI